MSLEEKYGINSNKPISALMVRDALVQCFYDAHCKDAGIEFEDSKSEINKQYCKSIIKKTFSDVGGDFDKPDKKSLEKVIGMLKEFSVNFRDQKIVEQHAQEIKTLIDKL